MPSAIPVMACPDCRRRAHMSAEFANSPSSDTCGERTFLLPSAWHDWQEFLMVSIQADCVFMPAGFPCGLLSAPGNSFSAGVYGIRAQTIPLRDSPAARRQAAQLLVTVW